MKSQSTLDQTTGLTLVILSVAAVYSIGTSCHLQLSDVYAIKQSVGTITGMTDSALHAYIGLAIFFATGLLLQKPFHARLPWLTVLTVELFNEAMDFLNAISHVSPGFWPNPGFWSNCLSDIVYTLSLPTLLFITTKFLHSYVTSVFNNKASSLNRAAMGFESPGYSNKEDKSPSTNRGRAFLRWRV